MEYCVEQQCQKLLPAALSSIGSVDPEYVCHVRCATHFNKYMQRDRVTQHSNVCGQYEFVWCFFLSALLSCRLSRSCVDSCLLMAIIHIIFLRIWTVFNEMWRTLSTAVFVCTSVSRRTFVWVSHTYFRLLLYTGATNATYWCYVPNSTEKKMINNRVCLRRISM